MKRRIFKYQSNTLLPGDKQTKTNSPTNTEKLGAPGVVLLYSVGWIELLMKKHHIPVQMNPSKPIQKAAEL